MAVRVEREGIESCIEKIKDAIVELENAASRIDKSMGEIPQYWEGAAYDKARSVYEDEYQKLLTKDVPTAVASFKDYIDQCKNKIIEIDEQLSGG